MTISLPPSSFLHDLANIAEQKTLQAYLNTHEIDVDTKIKKGFRFDPVTNVDRDTELLLRSKIQEIYPDHAIMGEEFEKN